MSEMSIAVNGAEYTGWTQVYVRKNLQEVAHSFNFSGSAPASDVLRHQDVRISIAGEAYSAGRIDSITRQLKPGGMVHRYTGRSYVRDLIDASATTDANFNFENKSLGWIFRRLCALYSVPYTEGAGVATRVVPQFVLAAESPWEKMVNEALAQGLIFTSDNEGGVILEMANPATLPVTIDEARVMDISETADGSKQSSVYVSYSGEQKIEVFDRSVPKGVHRPMDVVFDREAAPGEMRRRAETEMKRGRSVKYRLTLGGWEYAPGKPWDVNYRVNLDAPTFTVKKALLVSQVELSCDAFRRRAVLTLEEPDVYG